MCARNRSIPNKCDLLTVRSCPSNSLRLKEIRRSLLIITYGPSSHRAMRRRNAFSLSATILDLMNAFSIAETHEFITSQPYENTRVVVTVSSTSICWLMRKFISILSQPKVPTFALEESCNWLSPESIAKCWTSHVIMEDEPGPKNSVNLSPFIFNMSWSDFINEPGDIHLFHVTRQFVNLLKIFSGVERTVLHLNTVVA